ncbi:putative lipoprotein [Streptomyces lucensis JCM 4490]|uniref:Lipoprotein n=1 Tax=Streptomyces lucensis JCM 4490 TaxID=1306176 RepID=A0A918J7A2_9ACTN|nr:hypothetical protein [Streptomyces lucensis]GGW55010.1 putative lipoprotein [Streptomyces lucensis JCM 4490]
MAHSAHSARSARTARATRIGVFTAAVLSVAASLAGCSTAGTAPDRAGAAPAERPLLTKAEANRTVDAYQKANNRANAERSPSLMAKAEDGAVLAMDRAYFTQIPALDKRDVANNLAPFVYVHRTFYIPPASSNADWFLVRAQGAQLTHGKPGKPWSKDIRFLVFKRSGDGWRMVAARDFSGSDLAKAPHVALDGAGLMKIADPGTKIGGTAPSRLPELVADLWVTGGRDTPLADTSARRTGRSWYTERADNLSGHAWVDFKKAAPHTGDVFAAKTADGGALVLSDSAVDETFLAKDLQSYINLGDSDKPFVERDPDAHMYKVVRHYVQTELGIISADGEPAVYSIGTQVTKVDATPTTDI